MTLDNLIDILQICREDSLHEYQGDEYFSIISKPDDFLEGFVLFMNPEDPKDYLPDDEKVTFVLRKNAGKLYKANLSSFTKSVFKVTTDEMVTMLKNSGLSDAEIVQAILKEETVEEDEEEIPDEEIFEEPNTIVPSVEEALSSIVETVESKKTPSEPSPVIEEKVNEVEEKKDTPVQTSFNVIDDAKIRDDINNLANDISIKLVELRTENSTRSKEILETVSSIVSTLSSRTEVPVDDLIGAINQLIRNTEKSEGVLLDVVAKTSLNEQAVTNLTTTVKQYADVIANCVDILQESQKSITAPRDALLGIVDRYTHVNVLKSEESYEKALGRLKKLSNSHLFNEAIFRTLDKFWFSGDREVVDKFVINLTTELKEVNYGQKYQES